MSEPIRTAELRTIREHAATAADALTGWWTRDELNELCNLPVDLCEYLATVPPAAVLALLDVAEAANAYVQIFQDGREFPQIYQLEKLRDALARVDFTT